MGDNATASHNAFSQGRPTSGDPTYFADLAAELGGLRAELGVRASQAEEFEAAAAVARAEASARDGDEPSLLSHLAKAGQWALGIATSIGVPLATDALTKAIGG